MMDLTQANLEQLIRDIRAANPHEVFVLPKGISHDDLDRLRIKLNQGALPMTTQSLQASEDLSARNATAPRVSLADMEAAIESEHYLNAGDAAERCGLDASAPMHLMTLCFLTMQNGFVVLGKSAPASPENYDAQKGRTFAKEDAIRQLWPLMGFSLRDRLSEVALDAEVRSALA